MKNVIKLIASDIKRLSTNVVAMVVIIGLTVIPCLYAWFNILSNWDPYGPDATKNLQVAVVSSDQGILIGSAEVNVGDIIISRLKANNTIGWVFTDNAEEAIGGVYSGDYYAALVIDEEFSANMISFLGGNFENPKITYYENDKKNAIAPKITAKVKTTIEREVDHAFVGTVAEVLLKAGEYFATLDEQGNITGKGIEKLERLDSDLNGIIVILDSYIALIDSTKQISEAEKEIASTAEAITKTASEMADAAEVNAPTVQENIQDTKNQADDAVAKVNSKLADADEIIGVLNNRLSNYTVGGPHIGPELLGLYNKLNSVWSGDDGVYSWITTSWIYPYVPDRAKNSLEESNAGIVTIGTDLQEFVSAEENSASNLEEIRQKTVADTASLLKQTETVRNDYASKLSPTAQKSINSASTSVAEIKKLLKYNATSIDLVVQNLNDYKVILSQSSDGLRKSRDEAVEMEKKLAILIQDIKSLNQNEAYLRIMELLRSDPELLSDFISSPVEINEDYIYPVENNGSMTAPFYIILSIWVGALIMSTILKTGVKDTSEFDNLKNWECFFGRFFTTMVIGQIQTLITVLGAILFVGIQCEHKFMFWGACAWSAFVYSLLLYSFAYSFGNIGEALSVILMVIQVAGAGGTFPIEVLPDVFQALYRFMPFKYSMNAVRECIGGFYEDTYRNCMLTLVIYALVAVFIGVALYHPFKFINEKIEISKEKSGILL
ncbi:YhgE/Pip domain-containing protein [Pseudobutyrivibrio xylanivorans]|uniref:YhgE/Pip domain-containing protein n=1 Tax=Pseudobutyrivibrio xylanivorans TaxID=185007 RepID=A0A5P6VRA0_PSEXY|nr:YhgE/Pip domain-containing protein [Pseudobutyrivibrio xylanivorans]QFJ54209.1 YhgE/Pip domain-containing protein [Pseudobutyrivibrio xylanivorans]